MKLSMSAVMEVLFVTYILILLNFVSTDTDGLIGPKESRGHYALRRLDCSLFCKKTGFSGYVGGCQCGFTLFANKRSDDKTNGNIGFFSGTPYNGNKYSRNTGLKSSIFRGFTRFPNDNQPKYMTNFLIPYTSRPFGHI